MDGLLLCVPVVACLFASFQQQYEELTIYVVVFDHI